MTKSDQCQRLTKESFETPAEGSEIKASASQKSSQNIGQVAVVTALALLSRNPKTFLRESIYRKKPTTVLGIEPLTNIIGSNLDSFWILRE